ncbi:flagellar biosynthesis protein FlhF [Helicobacter sp. MIT 14-3879]|uniref:flagellar biosynthesis protein FlhF n=1 Tax=Helicobacter sp. MIT 14-3879 TaxID=2040649 RepID=UPI000E1EBF91|nr:flagellar biosynthesis protein FlhF [Helicobacter sp. MIT 14-3879]RDU65173.1 flagellar biosynthesis protein FlhF [Helicobacter sp. MIT 14-3879]
MQLYTYTAPTYKEAMELAKQKHGEDALVVSSKEVKKKTLLENGIYELVIAAPKEDENKQETQKEENDLPSNSVARRLEEIAQREIEKKRENKRKLNNDINVELSNAVKEITKIAQLPTKARLEPREINKENNEETKYNPVHQTREMLAKVNANELKELKYIKSSIEKLDDKMKLLQNMFWNDIGVRVQNNANSIPHEFAEIYRICKNSGMKNEHLDEIMQLSQNLMPINMRENSNTIKRYFREVLRKMIVCRAENIDMKRKRIVMLVGPTGVGKTTTIAKLATHYSMKHKYKVGLITLDGYRIGAYEQLAFYAKKLKLSINQVSDTAEFSRALEDLKYCDYILIDTIGSSQHDKQKLDILKRYANSDYNIDINLMLCATTKYEDLRDIYNSFGILNIDTLIFSKLDESKGFGNIFSLIYDTKKPVSYFTIGQEVPEDILVARNDYLADCIINGFSKPNRDEIIR